MTETNIPNHFRQIGTNCGHGHAWKRPDGVKSRCGGPRICQVCADDAALVSAAVEWAKGGEVDPDPAAPVPARDPAARINELLEANNRYQQEARDARAAAATALDQRNQLGQALGRVLVHAKMLRADVGMTGPELLMAAETFCGGPESDLEPATEQKAPPPAPWTAGADNAKIEGWLAFFTGRDRESCPFPPARDDLQRGFREGWDAAKEFKA